MSHISIHALTTAALPAAAPSATLADAQGFEAMLGRMAEKAAPQTLRDATADARDTHARVDLAAAPDAATLSALQSLEAALSGLVAKATPATACVAPTAAPGAKSAATPLGTALDQAAGALGQAAATGPISIKGMLQADPSLGLKDVQMRTFLGVAGATPARAGATPLPAEGAWSPTNLFRSEAPSFDMATAAVSASASPPATSTAVRAPAPAVPANAPLVSAAPGAMTQVSAPSAQSRPATPTPLPTIVATPPTAQAQAPAPPIPTLVAAALVKPVVAVAPAAPSPAISPSANAPVASPRKASANSGAPSSGSSPALNGAVAPMHSSNAGGPVGSATARSGGGGGAGASGGTASTDATAATSPDSAAAAPLTVALADLPAFLADQASSLTSTAAPDAPAASSNPATTPAAKTAQAVKELKISLDPADLGEMTVKLRLANGKLSVSIAVANPSTLGAIEDDRALIAARLAGGDQTLEDLVISRQTPTTQGVSQTHGSDDSGAATPDEGGSDPDAPPRPTARNRAGGDFGALLV